MFVRNIRIYNDIQVYFGIPFLQSYWVVFTDKVYIFVRFVKLT